MRQVFGLSVYFLLAVLLVSFMASLNYLGVVIVLVLSGLVGFWHRRLGNLSESRTQPAVNWYSRSGAAAKMDEGDFHSGPEGYSPNTAYPETQYGSNFDEDAAWSERGY